MSLPQSDPVARFWSKVDKSGDCWTWTAGRNDLGYGQFSYGGKGGKNVGAHRYAYMLTHGAIPEGAFVLHNCDNPSCVRPDHLRIGSQVDNMRDRSQRGRNPNALKRSCRNGHEYDEANTYVTRRGTRSCRACHRERERARHQTP